MFPSEYFLFPDSTWSGSSVGTGRKKIILPLLLSCWRPCLHCGFLMALRKEQTWQIYYLCPWNNMLKFFSFPSLNQKGFQLEKAQFVKIMKRMSSGFQNSKVSKTWLASHDQHFYHNGVLYEIFRKLIDLSSAQQKELNCQNTNYLPKVALEIYVKKKNGYTLIKSLVNCKDWTIFLREKKKNF